MWAVSWESFVVLWIITEFNICTFYIESAVLDDHLKEAALVLFFDDQHYKSYKGGKVMLTELQMKNFLFSESFAKSFTVL